MTTTAAVDAATPPSGLDQSTTPRQLGHTVHRTAGTPRALLCAVHGMGMTGAYFFTHTDAEATLVAVAIDAGFAVLVPDRPGYGSSADVPTVPMAEQARAVEQLIKTRRADLGVDLPVVLMGHSLGGRVALEVAAAGRVPVAGLEIAAAGYRVRTGVVPERAGGRREAWGPPACYPPGTFALARGAVAEVPAGEVVADAGWSARFLAAAARVRCPVRFAWAVHDRWWRHDESEAAAVTSAFPLAPWVTTSTLLEAGHNLHLGVHARRYNELTVDFMSRCLEEAP
jgi:pimeloyl-ACP methyl ester carboxylesterase